MRTLRYLAEYVAMRFALFLLDRVSLPAAESMANRFADVYFHLAVARRRITKHNVLLSGIARTEKEASDIARDSFRHFAVLVVESLKSGEFVNEQNWRERIKLDITPASMALFEKPGQGVILISGHLGNWEIAAQVLSYIKPVTGITRSLNNPYTDRLMQQRKPRNRFGLTPKHDAGANRFLSVLKNGEVLALLTDQHASGRGMMINFFGIPASTHTSPALLHMVTGAPICFGYCLRTGPMTYRMVIQDPLIHEPTGNKEEDVQVILEKLAHELESAIRLAPGQYLWAHRRWRNA